MRLSLVALVPAAIAVLGVGPAARAAAAPSGAPEAAESTVVIGPYVRHAERRAARLCWETDRPAATEISWGANPNDLRAFVDDRLVTRHDVVLDGLRPASVHWYRMAGDGGQGEAVPFRTEGDRADPLRIAVLGDTRTGHVAHTGVVAEIARQAPHLVLHTGDLVGSPSEAEWRTFFAIEEPLLRSVPLIPALGNHEGDGRRFLQLFGPDAARNDEGRYHLVRWGSVAVVVLDTNQPTGPGSSQYVWLTSTLETLRVDPDILFRLVVLHWGPYCAGSGHGSNMTLRANLATVFTRYGVDIVFSGHDHLYERSTIGGVKYVVTGGGGAPLHATGWDWWTEVAASAHHYCMVSIDGGALSFEARGLGGDTPIDRFVLRRRSGECATDVDCRNTPRECGRGDSGAFRCVATTCVWNCEALPSSPPRVRPRVPPRAR